MGKIWVNSVLFMDHGPGQPALRYPAWAGLLDKRIFRSSFRLQPLCDSVSCSIYSCVCAGLQQSLARRQKCFWHVWRNKVILLKVKTTNAKKEVTCLLGNVALKPSMSVPADVYSCWQAVGTGSYCLRNLRLTRKSHIIELLATYIFSYSEYF